MIDNDDKRTRGVMVFPLAPDAYDIPTMDAYALGINPHTGETFLIHTEGVSYQVTHNKPWRFNDYSLAARWHTLKDVRTMPVLEPVDLAVWVRSFGARLESNFRLAYNALTATTPREDEYNANVYTLLDSLVDGMNVVTVMAECPRGCGYQGRADYDKGWKIHFDCECPVQPEPEFVAE